MSRLFTKQLTSFKQLLQRHVTARKLLVVVFFIIMAVFWFRYIAGVVLVAIFIPITFMTIRYSKIVPHISAESNTAMTFFMGYTFGPVTALIYGPVVGVGCYIFNSFISPGYMLTPIIAGFSGLIVGILHTYFGMGFIQAFIIGLILRTLIAFPLFLFFYDPIEVTTHQVSQFLSNIIIYLPLLNALHGFIGPLI